MRTLKLLAGSALAFSLMALTPSAPTAEAAPAINPAPAVDTGNATAAEPVHYRRHRHYGHRHSYRRHYYRPYYGGYNYGYQPYYRSYSPGFSFYVGPSWGHRHYRYGGYGHRW
jgi:hypothetical protein